MTRPIRNAFLALIAVQAVHSIEEYLTRLYDRLAPARYVSGLVFADRRIGFVIFNVSLVAFGLWCWYGPIRRDTPSAAALAWFWVLLETLNGLAHATWAIRASGYRPGLATAPLLMAAAFVLARQLMKRPPSPTGAG